jgi:cytochrome oxidase Cu insertion factor (SCO1/SenC/PrrC family)/thiol-disulfide isomerase/thioredoxin
MARRRSVMKWVALTAAAVFVVVLATIGIVSRKSPTSSPQAAALATNPNLDTGTELRGPAPDFTLTNQFGRPVSMHSFRGKVVLLAFNDSECTTICPLTTTAMVNAKGLLGAAGKNVALLGVDANPDAISVSNVRAYSRAHGMLHQWEFATGSLPALRRVWKDYKIAVQIEQGEIDHTPALFAIDPQGRLAKLYITQMSYASVDQLAQVLAQEAADLLPGRPKLVSLKSYEQIPPLGPSTKTTLPGANGGSVALGPGKSPRLFVFFASWASETLDLNKGLDTLNQYRSMAAARGLPGLTAIDEGSVEPSQHALPAFLTQLPHPLSYPVAIDRTGRIADGYEVQDQPWLVLTSASGQILWYYDVSTQGWLSPAALAKRVQAALKAPPKVKPPTPAEVPQVLAGAPAPLASLHQQASRVLGSENALAQRLHSLRGYSVVINAWASWCGPCRTEFPLFASASVRYGKKVAFLGFDTNDSLVDARSFLTDHPVSYPSYQGTTGQAHGLLPQGLIGLPTTIFMSPAGKVTYVHSGQYDSQGTLDEDVGQYALGG